MRAGTAALERERNDRLLGEISLWIPAQGRDDVGGDDDVWRGDDTPQPPSQGLTRQSRPTVIARLDRAIHTAMAQSRSGTAALERERNDRLRRWFALWIPASRLISRWRSGLRSRASRHCRRRPLSPEPCRFCRRRRAGQPSCRAGGGCRSGCGRPACWP